MFRELPAEPPLDTSNIDRQPRTIMDIANPIIADRAEFVDALNLLRKGHILVQVNESAGGCLLDGGIVYHSYPALKRYGLIREFRNPEGFPHISYYRLTPRGEEFADKACTAWRRRPAWQRLAMRLVG
jgi:hypothetical protein